MLRHSAIAPLPQRAPPKKRGSYNCGRCGQPKKGHVCLLVDPTTSTPIPPRSDLRLRRALSFEDDVDDEVDPTVGEDDDVEDGDDEVEGGGALPASCLAQILKRLGPKELMGAAAVCKGWRDLVRRVWISAEEVKLKVGPASQIGFVGSVLNKCGAGLAKLMLTMERLLNLMEN